jgi:hypothetical protein
MCKNEKCPIYDRCDKEEEQANYCRKVELFVRLSQVEMARPRVHYVELPTRPAIN